MTLRDLETQAETHKLARLLDSTTDELSFLSDVPPEELRTFREQVTSALFDSHLGVLQRMANASRLLPAQVLAKIAERVFGPLLSARMAGLVDTSRGVDIATRLSPDFLADVAAKLDPRRAGGIITRLPSELVQGVAAELVRRADWIAIAQFVDSLPPDALRAGLGEIDDAALLRIAFLLENKDEVDNVVDLLDEARLAGLAHRAAATQQWLAAFDLLRHLRAENANRLTEAIGALEPESRAQAAEVARDNGLCEQLGTLYAVLES